MATTPAAGSPLPDSWPRSGGTSAADRSDDVPLGRAVAVVLAGGSGTRVGAGLNKVYLPLAGRRVVSWSFVAAAQVAEIGRFVLVVRPEDADLAAEALRRDVPGLPVEVVLGGGSRHESEECALAHLARAIRSGELDVVAVHDGARPLAGPALWRSVVRVAAASGGAVPVLPALDLLPADLLAGPTSGSASGPASGSASGPASGPASGSVSSGLDDSGPVTDQVRGLARVQTPQAFRATELLAGYAAARAAGRQGTDTASTVEAFTGLVVQAVPGTPTNLKVTYPHDLVLAECLLARS